MPSSQVKSGSIFDNILITDDLEAAKKFAEDTWSKGKDAEKAMFDKVHRGQKRRENSGRSSWTRAGKRCGT